MADLVDKILPAAAPSNPALEAAMREAKSDPGPFGVYADWLQSQNSPIGELAAIEARMEKGKNSELEKRRNELAKQLGLPREEVARFTYRHGFWDTLRLENATDWMDESFDAKLCASRLFATPLCAALDELRIGILRWDHNFTDVPAVLEIAAGFAWAKSLSRLHLGDVGDNIDMDHHTIGDVGERITKAFPKLRSLKLHSGSQTWRGAGETFGVNGLALPMLESLVVETCAMTAQRIEALLAAELPALTKLELWFGSQERDADATLDDVAPLLEGKLFPKVTDLGVRNQEFGIDVVERIAASSLGSRIERLDLANSTLDDDDAIRLAELAGQLPALRILDVTDNFIGPSGLSTLREAFKGLVAGPQPKLEYAEDGERFCSVHE